MERITLSEFISDVRDGGSRPRDGYEIGLIIDDSAGEAELVVRTLGVISARVRGMECGVDILLSAAELKRAMNDDGGGEVFVFLQVDRSLSSRHCVALESLAHHHALEEWSEAGTKRSMIRFGDRSRFVLVMKREVFEATKREFPALEGVLGATLSCDFDRKEDV